MTTPQPPAASGPPTYSRDRQMPSGSAYPPITETWPVHQRTTYQPTAEQLMRDERLKAHNRRTIYIPIIVAAIVAIALFVLLLVLAFGLVQTGQARSFIAGMSALVVILMAIPLTILMSILPLAYIGFLVNRRNQRKLYPESGPTAYRSRIQLFLWQVESFLSRAGTQIERGSGAIAEPFIKLGGYSAYARTMAEKVKHTLSRSEVNDTYDYDKNDTFDKRFE